jgi:uncharacterized Zn finger protein (UPF0148 family)
MPFFQEQGVVYCPKAEKPQLFSPSKKQPQKNF